MKRALFSLVMCSVLVALFPACAAPAQPVPPPVVGSSDTLSDKIERAILTRTLGAWWGEVIVIKDGKTVFSKGYGLENENLHPLNQQSLFDVGDLSKQFTATAVLRLEQDGKLSLSDPLSKFFPNSPDHTKAITLVQLLNMTSGISDKSTLTERPDVTDREQIVAAVLGPKPPFPPGEVYEYTNRGYCVAAAVVEKVAGEPFDEYMRKHIFAPVGLKNTGFMDGVGLTAERQTVRVGAGPRAANGRSPVFVAPGIWSWAGRGATGVVTCPDDLAKWDAVLRTSVLLNDAERTKLLTTDKSSYALAWYVTTTPRDTRRVWHGGSSLGFKALDVCLLDEGVTIAVLTNDEGQPDRMISTVEDVLFPPKPEKTNLTLFVKDVPPNPDQSGLLYEGPLAWKATRGTTGDIELSLLRGPDQRPLAKVVLSEGTARRTLASLRDVLRANPVPTNTPNLAHFTIATYPTPADGELIIPGEMWVEVRAIYRARNADASELVDRRPAMLLSDIGHGGSPLIVRMEPDSARELRQALVGAMK